MVAILDLPQLQLSASTEKRFFHGVTWDDYLRVCDTVGSNSHVRVTYSRGRLEIMSPNSLEHERLKELLNLIVITLALEAGRDFAAAGSVTMQLEQADHGGEPDSSYYFKHASVMRGVKRLDLSVHPAPELVVEVDVTSPSLSKLPLYAAVGVREVWRYESGRVTFHRLRSGRYKPVERSAVFPQLTSAIVESLVEVGLTQGDPLMVRELRARLPKFGGRNE